MEGLGIDHPEAKPLLAASRKRVQVPGWAAAIAALVLVGGLCRLCLAAPPQARVGPPPPPQYAAPPLAPIEQQLEKEARLVLRSSAGVESDDRGVVRWLDHKGQAFERYKPHTGAFRYVAPHVGVTAGIPVVNFHHSLEDVTGLVLDKLALAQPYTLIAVASPGHGDATILANAATGVMPHVALCHGWSRHGFAEPRVALTASGGGPDPLDPPEKILYGQTRDTLRWHVYAAVLDGPRSRLFVDGKEEARGDAGANGLEGLTLGGDQFGQRGLHGGVFEVWVLPGVLGEQDRGQLERRLREKYDAAFQLPVSGPLGQQPGVPR